MALTYNGNTPQNVTFNSTDCLKVTYNGTIVFQKQTGPTWHDVTGYSGAKQLEIKTTAPSVTSTTFPVTSFSADLDPHTQPLSSIPVRITGVMNWFSTPDDDFTNLESSTETEYVEGTSTKTRIDRTSGGTNHIQWQYATVRENAGDAWLYLDQIQLGSATTFTKHFLEIYKIEVFY